MDNTSQLVWLKLQWGMIVSRFITTANASLKLALPSTKHSQYETDSSLFVEEYAQFYGAMTMNREHMVNMRKDGLPYEEMGYSGPPPNR